MDICQEVVVEVMKQLGLCGEGAMPDAEKCRQAVLRAKELLEDKAIDDAHCMREIIAMLKAMAPKAS